MNDADLSSVSRKLLAQAGSTESFQIISLKGGGNNRVLELRTPTRSYAMKVYFTDPHDGRDRRTAEMLFAEYAWHCGIRCLPEMLASDKASSATLFSFIKGRNILPDEINEKRLKEAVDFFLGINREDNKADARKMPEASEACFSLPSHMESVARRIQRLNTLSPATPADYKSSRFITEHLRPAWKTIEASARKNISSYGPLAKTNLPTEERCISPSDFGFHNAIINERDNLIFFDFEYAGWDDPAKMVCDFFSQVDKPVPMSFFTEFVTETAQLYSKKENFLKRVQILLPVYKIKWCCIILNEFLKQDMQRRCFAQPGIDPETAKLKQLEKARTLLESICTEYIQA